MKRLTVTLFAIVLLFSMSSLASAQGLTGYGLKAGLNMATLGGDDVQDAKMKMGFAAGGFVTYSINEMFAVQPEVLYTMKGAKWEEELLGETLKETTKYTYLEIPVLAKFTIPTQGNISPKLFVGPALGILLSAKCDSEWGDESETDDIKDDTKSPDFGLVFGAGVDIGMPHSAITIDGRYTMGLSSIAEAQEVYNMETHEMETIEPDSKNSVISFTVGYSF